MKKIVKLLFLNLLLILCLPQVSLFAQPTSLPLMQINELEYQGAFGIPYTAPNNLSANYSTGTIAYNPANNSLFVAGHEVYGTVGEFSIPTLVNTKTNASALNQATLLQGFRPILNAAATGNSQNINKITGMTVINGKLMVNAEDYYDAAADNTHTTLVVENPSNIANSTVNGYHSIEGAAHAGGWMSSIPAEWQSLLGGSYIAGHSSRYSINGRYPMGITAFAFNPSDISGASGTVPTTTLLDYSLADPLYADYNSYVQPNYNLLEADLSVVGGAVPAVTGHTFAEANAVVGTNDLWTEVSQASYGFIVPGTRTYLTIGSSGGHNGGIGYKPAQNTGYICAGPCTYDAEDYDNYYWLWDVNDLLDVKNGVRNPHDVRPYDYGVFEALFRTEVNPPPIEIQKISGGTFDAANGILYLSIYHGASVGQYERLPAIVAYKVNGGGNNCPTAGTSCNDNNPNTTNDVEDGFCNCSGTPITPPSGGCELLSNTGFDSEITPWVYWGADVASVNGTAAITNIISSTNIWEVGFIQSNIPVEQGENYTIKFRARADANRPLNVRIELDGSPYTEYYNTDVNLTPTMQDYTLNFTMTEATDNNANFIFYLGGDATSTYIDNASLEKADCQSCPAAGTPCNDGDPNTANDVEDGFCNCSGTPITPPSGCELLSNTNFDNNINNWVEWGCNVAAVNGVANITNIISATNSWEVGFSQSQQNITLVQGETYEVTFRASADANRELYLYVGMLNEPYTAYHYQTVNLTTTMQEFTATFTMNSPTDSNINFDFNFGGNTTNTYIDYASLEKVNCGTPPPTSGQCDCPDISTNGTIISVSNITQLENAINNSNGNETIMVQPGDYVLNTGFNISANKPNLTIMGATGNRDDVTLRGLGWNNSAVTHIFDVSADGFTVANMTISDVYYHLIQIHSENDADDFTVQNVRFLNAKEQLLKVSAGASTFSDRGSVLCCAFEFTNGIAYQNYTGGIDAHKSKNWIVQNNTFEGIRSPDGVVAEHAIHFWRDCEGTIVIGNQIERCDRGIGFGLGNIYENGHRGGLIMNNFVHTNRDVGIGLEYAPDIKVYNNTVITDNYPRSIEYRFSGTTNVQIINNLVSGEISDRSSGSSATLATNYTVSNFNVFTNSGNYDYHLAGAPSGIVDAGTILGEVNVDIDCDNRISGAGMDIGADEVSGANNENESCDVFDEQNFESGWGIWNDGGSDARRSDRDPTYVSNDDYCVRLRDNSGSGSSMYTDALDMSLVTSVDVSFTYITTSMESNEDFFLELSTDGGTSYAVVQEWNSGVEFVNGTRYEETVSIYEPFSSNTVIRLRCDASANNDMVYIDDITIEACGGAIVPAKLEILPSSISVNLYPNPANHSIQLDCEISESTQAQIQVYDNIGQLVKNMTNIELHEGTQTINVDVSDLPAGMYFCALQSNEWQTVKKFVIAR